MYLLASGRPTEIGLQLDRVCCARSRCGKGACFYIFCFFTVFHFFLILICLPLSSSLLFHLSLFSLSLGEDTK